MKTALNRSLILLLILTLFVSAFPMGAMAKIEDGAPTAMTESNEQLLDDMLASLTSHFEDTDDDWAAMDLAAFGKGDLVSGKSLIEFARETYQYSSSSYPDWERSTIMLTSLGVNARKVYDGQEGYLDFLNKSHNRLAPQSVTDAAFALLALDSGKYDDNDLPLNRENILAFLLDSQLPVSSGQVGWTLRSDEADVDVTAMVLSALSPYYLQMQPIGNETEVKTAVDGAINYLAAVQNSSGDYGNANSTAMVIVALSALGIDANQDQRFIKNENSILNGLMSFRTEDNLFAYELNGNYNFRSTEQGFRALISYHKLVLSDQPFNIYSFSAPEGDGSQLTGETKPNPQDPSGQYKTVTVRVEDLHNDITLLPLTTVQINGSALDALNAALYKKGYDIKDAEVIAVSSAGYIESILNLANDFAAECSWMYAVNDSSPWDACDQYLVHEHDEIVFYYLNWNDEALISSFDARDYRVDTGKSLTVALSGSGTWTGTRSPIAGASIQAYDNTGAKFGSAVITNKDGQALLSFAQAGNFTLRSSLVGANNANTLISYPATIVVIGGSGSGNGNNKQVTFSVVGNNKTGTLIHPTIVTIDQDASVFDILKKTLQAKDISMQTSRGTEIYIKEIGGLKEFDDGPNSGWVFTVNDEDPVIGIASCIPNDGDVIKVYFTDDYTQDPVINLNGSTRNASEELAYLTPSTTIHNGIASSVVEINEFSNFLKIANDKTQNEVVIQLNYSESVSKSILIIPSSPLREMLKNKVMTLRIKDSLAEIILPSSVIKQIVSASENTISLTIELHDNQAFLSANQGLVSNHPLLTLAIAPDKNTSPITYDEAITIAWPYTLPANESRESISLYQIVADGKVDKVAGSYNDYASKSMVFAVNSLATYALVYDSSEEIKANSIPLSSQPVFEDVSVNDWFHSSVEYMVQRKLMLGTTETTFSPNEPLSRAMLAAIMYRLAGAPDVAADNPFIDVEDNQWYTPAVIWAYANQIMSGYDNEHFGTHDPITREQLAVVLFRYSAQQSNSINDSQRLAISFDTEQVSPWAHEAWNWSIDKGLILERNLNTSAPQESASRAEATAIFKNYLES